MLIGSLATNEAGGDAEAAQEKQKRKIVREPWGLVDG